MRAACSTRGAGSLSGSCAARARLDGDDASWARRRGPFGRSTPTTGCPSRGTRLQRARRQGEPGSWALEPRARFLLGRSSVGTAEESVCSRRGQFYARPVWNLTLGPRAGMERSQEAPGDFKLPAGSHNGVERWFLGDCRCTAHRALNQVQSERSRSAHTFGSCIVRDCRIRRCSSCFYE